MIAVQLVLSMPLSGVFDASTALAVRHFQEVNGLKPDEKVGPLTWAALLRNYHDGLEV